MKQSMMEIANTVIGFERNKEVSPEDSKPLEILQPPSRWKDEDLDHLRKWVGYKDLNEIFAEHIKTWRDLADTGQEAFIMAQIEAMFRRKYQESAKCSLELRVPYAVDGYSHFPLINYDREIFIKYSRLVPLHYDMMNWGACGLHVESVVQTYHILKEGLQQRKVIMSAYSI